jgi:membrane protein
MSPYRRVAGQTQSILGKYLADRGPHLGAMVAYYALLAIFPFVFISLSTLGLFGRLDESSYLIRELHNILPGVSVETLLATAHAVQRNTGVLLTLGLLGMLWATLGFFSALESAFNIVFRVENRRFLHSKGTSFLLVLLSLLVLFAALTAVTAGTGWVQRRTADFPSLDPIAYGASLAGGALGIFVFLMIVYSFLTNVELRRGDVWPGALFATIIFMISYQIVPLYLRFSSDVAAYRAFGGILVLLVWLYLMANVIVMGAEINWNHWQRNEPTEIDVGGLA